jgi:hypothetical protein
VHHPTGQPTGQPSGSPSTQPTSMPSTTIEGANSAAVANATTDILAATLTGSVSAVAAVIDAMGPSEVQSNNFAYTAVASAIFNGHSNIVDVIVGKTGMNLNQQGKTGNTLLMWACQFGNFDIVKSFLDMEVDATLTNSDGLTAMQLASKNGFRSIVNLLRSYGVSN